MHSIGTWWENGKPYDADPQHANIKLTMIGSFVDWCDNIIDRRFATRPGWIILIELFLGLGWARASVEKIIEPQWWNGAKLDTFIVEHEPTAIGWYRPILDLISSNAVWAWAAAVLALEIIIAAALLLSRYVGTALIAGSFLSINFVLSDVANPGIFYLILQLGLGLWLLEEQIGPTRAVRVCRTGVVVGLLLGLACLPYQKTIRPEHVIEDPAAVLSAGSFCAALAFSVTRRRIRRRELDQSNPAAAVAVSS